jgi:Tol biopolymer transport system component/predicted Ser/Thr protein kinase
MIGKTVSHYRIMEELGRGGMGVVYKAEDIKLKRTVALKFLPSELTKDPEAKKRFIHEAQAASALQHHHVATVHEINETEDGQIYICMDYYPGEALNVKMKGKPLSVDEAVHIAIQIARGLDKAHQKGIVHRDIKPGNAVLSEDGIVKIVDFGLAKLSGRSKITQEKSTIGTTAYMSPEQTGGKEVDHRTDIWSLGVILYEMIAGKKPFCGDYEQAVIYAILNEDPRPLTSLRTDVSTELERIVNKAITKNPKERYQHIDEILVDLQTFQKRPAGKRSLKDPPSRHKIGKMILVSVVIMAIVCLVVILIRGRHTGDLQINRTIPLTTASGLEQDPTWSPEGTRIAYSSDENGNMDIWVLQIAAGQRVNLTEDHTGFDGKPAWSPDGEWIAFVSVREGGGIFVIPALGGIPKRVVAFSFAPSLSYSGSIPPVCWSPDGTELAYANSGILYTVPANGGTPTSVPLPPTNLAIGYSEPAWAPDGQYIAYTDFVAAGVATSQIWLAHRDGSDPTPVTRVKHFDYHPVWSSDGKQLFFISDRGGSQDVWWLSVDTRGHPEGAAHRLTAGAGVGTIALSGDGSKLAYTKILERTNIWSVPIVPGRTLELKDASAITFENHLIDLIHVSPDGKWIAFDSNRSGNQDIWIMRQDGSQLRQLSTDPAHDWSGSWSPDGDRIVFHSLRYGNRDIFVMPVTGGAVTPLTNHPAEDIVPVWSPDGKKIAFVSNRSGTMEVWVMSSNGGIPLQLTFQTVQDVPCWSPDGKCLVFSSRRTGHSELFLISSEGGDPIQLTHHLWVVITPFYWSANRRSIYAWGIGGPGKEGYNLWEVSVSDGEAQCLMAFGGSLKEPYFMSSDGEHIFFTLWERSGDLWLAELSRRQ